MSNIQEIRKARTWIFVDYRNLRYGFRNECSSLQVGFCYFDIIRIMRKIMNVEGVTFFDGQGPGEDDDHLSDLHLSWKKRGCEVNLRDCKGWQTKEQKQVDVTIALIMHQYALEERFDNAVLISGDSDFIPAVELLRQMGKTVFVASFNNSLSLQLAETADYGINLSKFRIQRYLGSRDGDVLYDSQDSDVEIAVTLSETEYLRESELITVCEELNACLC